MTPATVMDRDIVTIGCPHKRQIEGGTDMPCVDTMALQREPTLS